MSKINKLNFYKAISFLFLIIITLTGCIYDFQGKGESNVKLIQKMEELREADLCQITGNELIIEFMGIISDTCIPFVDNRGFKYLTYIYESIDFLSGFENEYVQYIWKCESYLENLYNLLMGQTVLYIPKRMLIPRDLYGELYLRELFHDFDPSVFRYYFLNFSGNGGFELGIYAERSLYVLRYDLQKSKFYLWYYVPPGWTQFVGTRRLSFGGNVAPINRAFVMLNAYGNKELITTFHINYFSVNSEEDSIYLVSWPQSVYDVYLPQHLETQVVTQEYNSNLHFRVTHEQFQLITQDYFYARVLGMNIRAEFLSFEDIFN